jgi:hypothetical protein
MEKENKKPIPSKKAFTLSKAKLASGGGLDVHYEVSEQDGNANYLNKHHDECAQDVQKELRELFQELRPIVGRIFNITSFKTLMETDEFKATEGQKALGDDFAQECLNKIEVRGISLSGKDDKVGVVITSVYEVANGQKVAINTPRIRFDSETWGFEEELENIVYEIENEVYEFLFMGKKAELSLFGEDQGEGEQGDQTEEDNY